MNSENREEFCIDMQGKGEKCVKVFFQVFLDNTATTLKSTDLVVSVVQEVLLT